MHRSTETETEVFSWDEWHRMQAPFGPIMLLPLKRGHSKPISSHASERQLSLIYMAANLKVGELLPMRLSCLI